MRYSMMTMADSIAGPISASIKSKLQAALEPVALKLTNDSHKHSNHYKPDGSSASDTGETHFRLEVVSSKFDTMPMIKRHQLVYSLLDAEIKAGVHALTMSTKTPEEAVKAK